MEEYLAQGQQLLTDYGVKVIAATSIEGGRPVIGDHAQGLVDTLRF